MDARKTYSYKPLKYSKGYEVHKPQPGWQLPGGWGDREVKVGNNLPHIKWRDGSGNYGHIFFNE
jgi:hypothetical protein